jgi:uncharacterized protein
MQRHWNIEVRRSILIVDPPGNWTATIHDIDNEFKNLHSANAAIFFPHIKAPDLLDDNNNNPRSFVPSGIVTGAIARTDTNSGVWKAPAGTDTALVGVSDLTVLLTDDENSVLNQKGINCLRVFHDIGIVIGGSRTMSKIVQWKYLPVRRTALYIEESIYRGTQWAVFELNDERLWSQIRLNIGSFMKDLFVRGAFQGGNPKEAYFVKCDNKTTTQNDIEKGVVNIVVGFAPLKPAEFVIIQVQQQTGNQKRKMKMN